MKKYILHKIFYLSIILTALFLGEFVEAQQFTNFRNFTNMKKVTAIKGISNGVWAATSGGGFFFNSSTKNYSTFHKTEGFSGTKLTAITIDNNNNVWFGSEDGKIDIYNPTNNSTQSILDIFNSGRSNKIINELSVSGDTIIVSTDFGISLIDSKTLVFIDTFFKFGTFSSNIRVNSTSVLNKFYASTISGVAIQKDGAINLSAPESWNVFTTANGLPSNNINKITKFKSNIIAATSNGLSQFNGTKWNSFLSQINNNIKDLYPTSDTLYILSNNTISAYGGVNVFVRYTSSVNINKISYSQSLGLLAATDKGIVSVYGQEQNLIFPNGPEANQFPSMTVDNNGNLWSASGRDVTGVGFYKFDGNTWTNFNKSNTAILPSNSYHVVYSAPDNTKYFGNWGFGFLSLKDNVLKSYDTNNTDLVGIDPNPNFLVISGFGTDSQNNLWVLNYWASNRKVLSALTSDGVWHHFQVAAEANLTLAFHFNLVIDRFDTKWYSSTDPKRSGLYFFNENNSLDNTANDASGLITTTNGLNSNSISSIVLDKQGELWVGTNLGVNVISNLGAAPTGLRISSVFALRQSINTIAVDPLNQKWVGTNQGLLLVNSDGTQLLSTLNTTNSPLLSDKITSIAINENNGDVFVGTSNGLTVFRTTSVLPKKTFTELSTYPSPFILDGNNQKLTIDGLIKDSEIKILSISGKLIREFTTPGGRVAFWDGRDRSGNFVNSGVYIIVAFDKLGNNTVTGKVAVLRK